MLSHLVGGWQDAVKCPIMHRTATHNKELLAPNVSSAQVEDSVRNTTILLGSRDRVQVHGIALHGVPPPKDY
jgi:hypothetical protein